MLKYLLVFINFSLFSIALVGQNIPEWMYYKFDGSGTSVPNDASSPIGNNPATLVSHSQGGIGQFGGALQGGGTGLGLATGYSTNLVGDWTMSFWINFGSAATTFQYIFGDPGASSFRIFANGAAGVGNITLRGPFTCDVSGVADGNPHVVHFVRRTTTNNVIAYVDGVINNTITFTGSVTSGSGMNIGAYSTASPMVAGVRMDEFRLYNRALDLSEIVLTYNQTLPIYSAPNDAGITDIIEPLTGCVGTRDVEVEVSNLGINQITSVTVHWTVNGIFQTPYVHNQLLDTANGIGPSSAVVTLGSVNLVNTGNYNIRAWTVLPNAVNDTVNYNDTSDISLTGVNYPIGSLGLDTTICPGEPITLTASPSTPDSTIWNDTTTTNSRLVSTAGLYKVSIYKSGCRTDDSINVSLYPAPPTVNLGNDTTICYGDVLTLNATTTGVTYTWHDNSTSATYDADTSGIYSVIIEDANTCKSGDTIRIYLFQEPKVTLFVNPGTSFCYGTPFIFTANGLTTGSKMYQLVVNGVNVGSPQVGNTFSSPPIKYGDTVRVDMLTDQCATIEYAVPSNSLVMLIRPEPRLINALTADTVLENTSKNYALAPIGNNGYLWRVSGGSINGDSTTFAVQIDWDGPNPNAWVSVTERDATNCSYENILPVNVISIEGISESENGYLGNAYPNPANKTITIPVSSKAATDIQLGLYDLTGKEVRMIYRGNLNGSRNFVLDVSELNEGMYFYKLVTSEGKQETRKIMIHH